MLRPVNILMFLAIVLAGAAHGGPWPRAEGATYALAGFETGDDERGGMRGGWSSLYLERGLPRRLTFGVEGGARPAREGVAWAQDDARWRAFLRLPLDDGTGPWRFAVEAGPGLDLTREGRVWRLGAGLSAGRGFSSGLGDGWMVAGLLAELAEDRATRLSASAKIGLKPGPDTALELGLFLEQEEGGDLFATFGPVWERRLTPILSGRLGALVTERGRGRLSLGVVAQY
jgi:hypothetical protein